MKERGILFSAPMVRAILDGRKTQTRRVLNPQPFPPISGKYPPSDPFFCDDGVWRFMCGQVSYDHNDIRCPFGLVGDRLYVRETHALVPRTAYAQSVGVQQAISPANSHDAAIYREGWDLSTGGLRWRPSIHMPRWASRVTLEVTAVRVERVQQITDTDGMREGWQCDGDRLDYLPRDWYRELWNSLNAKRGYGWDVNPWVWVIEFKRLEQQQAAA